MAQLGRRHCGVRGQASPITIPARPCASCKVKRQPRELLAKVGGLSFKELPNGEPCCGFGGTFCVKFPDISNRMVEDKVANIEATGADVVLAADMGCLLNIAGKLKRAGSKVEARHVAEVLAGMARRCRDRRGAVGRCNRPRTCSRTTSRAR